MQIDYIKVGEEDYNFIFKLVYKNLKKVIQKSFKGTFNFEVFFRRLMSSGEAYIITLEKEKCGFIWYTIRGRSLHVNSIVLGRYYQGKGIGSRVFDELENKAAEMGLEYIRLGVQGINKKAKLFYENRGFTEESYVEDYDTFYMRKSMI